MENSRNDTRISFYAISPQYAAGESTAPDSPPCGARENAGMFGTMSAEILERVKMVTVKELGVKEEEVVNTASFTEDLGADSLDVVELVMAFEEEFEIDIPDDDVPTLKTIDDAVNYILSKKG